MVEKELALARGLSHNPTEEKVALNGEPEIRFGDVEQDSKELARLFSQPSSLPHLAGVTPERIKESERLSIDIKYTRLPIMAATLEDVRKYYEKNTGLTLIVAEDQKERGKLLGSVTVQTGNVGVLAANIARLVVDEAERGKGIGRRLVKAADAYIFNFPYFQQATASIILKVPGDFVPQKILRDEKYKSQNELADRCVSWDPAKGIFVVRNVLPMILDRKDYMGYALKRGRKEIEQYLPKAT